MITKKQLEDGKITSIKNFLTHKEAVDFWYLTNTCEWSYGRVSNSYSGQRQGRMTRAFDVEVFERTDVWLRYKKLFKEKVTLGKAYINYSDHATINLPHCDGSESGPSALICLNNEWKKDWCGYTAIFKDMHSNDIVYTSVPEPGKIIIFSGAVWHSGLPVAHFACYPRLMLTLHTFIE